MMNYHRFNSSPVLYVVLSDQSLHLSAIVGNMADIVGAEVTVVSLVFEPAIEVNNFSLRCFLWFDFTGQKINLVRNHFYGFV